jgi:hypothetical protein
MIKLEELDNNTRLDLIRGCEPFYITYRSPKWQNNIVDVLCKEFGKTYEIPIRVILTAASKAKRYGLTGTQFPLDFMKFKKAESKTKKNIPYSKTKDLISLMEKSGYLTLYVGFKNKTDGISSAIRFHDKLLNCLDKKMCDKWGMSRFENLNLLEVIDSENSTQHKDVFHSLKKFKGVKKLVEDINLVNKNLCEHLITYKGETCCVVYKRRFEDDLQSAGRWYVVGTFQVEDSYLRNTIMIDSTPTVEIDIKHIHPSILASISGFKLKKGYDPYDITSYVKTPLEFKVLREFIKPCFMALLYANNRGTALHTIREKLWDNRHIATWLDAETILEALEEHNHMLSEFFYHKDNWKLCQFIDSQIATKIMVHFASKGEVCLNYHDSWIVTYHNKQELINVMRDSWEHVIGNLDNFGYDIEFDNTPKVKQGHPAFESIPIEYYEE